MSTRLLEFYCRNFHALYEHLIGFELSIEVTTPVNTKRLDVAHLQTRVRPAFFGEPLLACTVYFIVSYLFISEYLPPVASLLFK